MTTSTTTATVTSIVTHPGVFHADDVCAVAWLRISGCDVPVERRVPTPADVDHPTVMVIDIGGRNEPALLNFDHHQRGGAGARWDSEVPYAAFGLVFDQFPGLHDPRVVQRLHDRVVLPVDAADAGWGTKGTRPELSFSACVAGFNPGPSATQAERDEAFEEAVAFARQVLANELRSAAEFVTAKQAVMTAGTDLGGQVLVLEKFAPWGEHVFSREDQADLLYVIFPSERGGWMLQQVAKEPGSFEGRKPLPATWAGLRDQALRDLTNVASATFVHPGRFCGGAETLEGALAMAALAVKA